MRPKKLKWKKELLDLSFLLPALLLFLFIIIVPLISGVRFTFTDWDGMSPVQNFVGLKNYRTVFTDKDLFSNRSATRCCSRSSRWWPST